MLPINEDLAGGWVSGLVGWQQSSLENDIVNLSNAIVRTWKRLARHRSDPALTAQPPST